MKLNKKVQYGLLLCLYLSRSGRSKIEIVALNLNLSRSFLDQVANKLKNRGVIKSFKGPGGGFELIEDAKMLWIFQALDSVRFLTDKEIKEYITGTPEKRALSHFTSTLSAALNPLLNRRVVNVMKEVVANEMGSLNTLNIKGLEH